MATARCADCEHRWETDRPAEDIEERPACPDCGSGRVDVEASAGWFMVWR